MGELCAAYFFMFCGFWVFLCDVYLFFNFLFLLFSQVFSSLRYKGSGKGIHLPPPSGRRPPCPWRPVPPLCLKDPAVRRPFRWVLHPVLRSGGRSQCASPTCPSMPPLQLSEAGCQTHWQSPSRWSCWDPAPGSVPLARPPELPVGAQKCPPPPPRGLPEVGPWNWGP